MRHTSTSAVTSTALAAGLLLAAPAQALDRGDWLFRVGASHVAPNVDSDQTPNVAGGEVDVDSDTRPSFTIGYMFTDNVALEVLGAIPFSHDIEGAGSLSGLGKIGETKHLPPTFSVQYHFQPHANIRPFAGIGVNYTHFFDEEHTGPLAGESLSLDASWGLAGQLGVDFDLNKNWFGSVDVRYMNIETEATSSVAGTFDVELNPWVVSVGFGSTF